MDTDTVGPRKGCLPVGEAMTETEFQTFLTDLRALCVRHNVQLTPSKYDFLQVWPLMEGMEPLAFPDIQNRTEPKI